MRTVSYRDDGVVARDERDDAPPPELGHLSREEGAEGGRRAGIVTIGETMAVFRATSPGHAAHVDGFRLGIGGAETNVAIGLRRLGTPATWIGRVGADELGRLVQRELRAEGVDVRTIVDPAAPTGVMVKIRPTPDTTRVSYHRAASAGSRLAPGDLDPELIAAAGALHVTGITPALSASAAATVDAAIDAAAAVGVPVSFDVNHRTSLWRADDAAATYRRIAERSTIVFAGLEEAQMIAPGESPAEVARAITAYGPSQVVIKLGAEGCHARIEGAAFDVPAVPVTVRDTVGAGDGFVAGYLAALLAREDPEARLSLAVRVGAFACLGEGDWESLPFRADLATLEQVDPVER